MVATHRRTGIVWDERFLWHNPGGGAGVLADGGDLIEPGDFGEEGPHPRRRLRNLIEVTGLRDHLHWLAPRSASEDELLGVHSPEYVERIRHLSAQGGGDAGNGTPFGSNGYEVARLAAGGCITAVDNVLTEAMDNAYALVKPPGHHASRDSGNGHCIFNNVAIAAIHAKRAYGIERISVIDWDVHWGNGAQSVFWEDPSVQVISLHQADWYPRGGGSAGEVGGGAGVGAHINVPLPPGSGIGAYAAAFERIVVPAVASHRPELILVSCGYDASAMDPSGRMLLSSADFRLMIAQVAQLAVQWCDSKFVVCHEGGYAPTYVPFCGVAVLEEMSGLQPVVADPFLARFTGVGYEGLQSHQSAAIDEVVAVHAALSKVSKRFWAYEGRSIERV